MQNPEEQNPDASSMILEFRRSGRLKKEIVFWFVEDYPDWESAEALYFISVIGAGSYEVKAAADSKEPISSVSGVRILPDYDTNDILGKFKGIVLVGGIGWTNSIDSKIAAVRPVVEDAVKRECPIGGVGTGADVLGAFGLLNHGIHTGNSSSEISLVSSLAHAAEPSYQGEEFYQEAGAIRNGRIVTARNTSGLAFARAFLWTLDVDQKKADDLYEEHRKGAVLPLMDFSEGHA